MGVSGGSGRVAVGDGQEGDAVVYFFNDTATTEIDTSSLHDARPIWAVGDCMEGGAVGQ